MVSLFASPAHALLRLLAPGTQSVLADGGHPSLAALIALGAGALAVAGYVVVRRNRPR